MRSEAFSKVVSQLGLYNYEGSQWRTACPVHQQEDDLYRDGFGLDFEQAPDGRVHFTCRKGCAPLTIGAAFGLAPAQIVLAAAPAPAACLALPHEIFNGPDDAPPARPAAPEPPGDHFYYDANRVLVAVKRRIRNADGSKRFVWFTAAGYKTGRAGLDGLAMSDLPLYRLLELRAAEGKRVVWVVEGERKCDVLLAHGLPAVTVAGGAGHRDVSQLADELEGRLVALWPDNDEPGQEFMRRVAAALRDRANSCRWVLPPDLPPKGDAADFFAAGRTVDELWDLYTAAPQAPGEDDHQDAEDLSTPYREYLRRLEDLRAAAVTEPVEVRLDEVTPTTVRWLWPGRIPLGKITVLDGDPGLGKSLLTLDLAARVSRGDVMPDGAAGDLGGPAGVLLLSAEDSVADTIRPRLDAAGADPARVVALPYVQEGQALRLPTLADTAALEKTMARQKIRLVIVDPLMAYLGAEVHAHRDQDVRRILAPLAALAEQTGAAMLVVRHLNKSGQGSALYRGGGSIGIIGAARAGLLVAQDPDDSTGARRIVVGTKSNLGAPPPPWPTTSSPAPTGPPGWPGTARPRTRRRPCWRPQPRLTRSRRLMRRKSFYAAC